MIQRLLKDITVADIELLVANAVSESKTIEYKRALPGSMDAEKKEFLADVSSFANTTGGDLIFGIDESQGLPTGIVGLGSSDLDLEIRRLDSILTDGLEPRIRYATKIVDCGNSVKVLLFRVERSWYGPHRVVFKGNDKFYGRNSAGKYSLDVGELRAAFTLSVTVTDRISAFRIDRVIALSSNDTPVPFVSGPKIILHCIPLEAFAARTQYDVKRYARDSSVLLPIYSSRTAGWSCQINLDGVISYSVGDAAISYTQLYRNGTIEAVVGSLLAHEYEGKQVIPSIAYEKTVFDYLPFCFQLLKDIGCNPPVVIAISLTDTRGLRMAVDAMGRNIGSPIRNNQLLLPEITLEDFSTPPGQVLKPMFDLVWNASGYPESRNFDSDGNWITRK
jgi:hypothetical protein